MTRLFRKADDQNGSVATHVRAVGHLIGTSPYSISGARLSHSHAESYQLAASRPYL